MGALCRRIGPHIYANTKDKIVEGVRHNLQRQPLSEAPDTAHAEQLLDKLTRPSVEKPLQRRRSVNAEQIFHDTAGWKHLETWMKWVFCILGQSFFERNIPKI